jgi:2-methylcitrate dehydratase PrpD
MGEQVGDWVELIARFVAKTNVEELSEAAREMGCLVVMDCLGATLAGSNETSARIVRRLVSKAQGEDSALVFGTSMRSQPEQAAWANGVAAHALDFDDTSRSMEGHPSVSVLPVAFALAESESRSGAELLAGFLVGYELQAKMGKLVGPLLRAAGWHSAGVLGTLGAAATASRLLQLHPHETIQALGTAASMASGLGANTGSMVKPLHAGNAARNGLIAARLSQCGFTSQRGALDGFVFAFSGAKGIEETALCQAVEQFGRPFDILVPGTDIKLYPSCNYTHPAIDAALYIAQDDAFSLTGIKTVTCTIGARGRVLLRRRPATGLEAKFSVEFCVACALADRRVEIESFRDAEISRLTDLMSKVAVEEKFPANGDPIPEATVTVRWFDGKQRSSSVVHPKGSVGNPITRDDVEAKYRRLAGRVIREEAVDESIPLIRRVDTQASIRSLMKLLQCESR